MERRVNLTRVFTGIFVGIIVVTTISAYLIASHVNRYDNDCKRLGGIPLHGTGIDLCVKPETLVGEENG